MKAIATFVGVIVLGLLLSVVGALVAGILVLWAWNTVIPSAFGLPSIDYIQAVALSLLGTLLIKSSVATTK